MKETRIHIVSGEVVLNPEPRPTEADYTWFTLDNAPTFHEYKFTEALAEWKKNCIKAKNALIDDSGKPWMVHPNDEDGVPLDFPTKLTPGQKVLAEGNVVTKII